MIALWCDENGETGYKVPLDVVPSKGDPVIWDGKTRHVHRICWTPQDDGQDLVVTVS